MSRSGIQPSVPDRSDNALDWEHLDQATFGDRELATEVLGLFAAQVGVLAATLRDLPPDACGLAHKLKGSARGIGAWQVADAAENLEAALAASADPRAAMDALLVKIVAARTAIETHLHGA